MLQLGSAINLQEARTKPRGLAKEELLGDLEQHMVKGRNTH